MRFLKEKTAWLMCLLVVAALVMCGGNVYAYYGSGYSSYGTYGGLGSLTGSGSAVGNVTYGGGSLYGGLYGSSLGGLYGSSLYGGLYGRLGLDAGSEQLARQSQLLLPGLTTTALPTAITGGGAAAALPDPTGLWGGTWLSYITLKGGIANFSLVYDPLTLTVSGTAGLLLNKLIPIPISVAGINTATGFTLTGSFLDPTSLVTYYAEYTCTIIAPGFMDGNYLIHDALFIKSDTGEFHLTL